MRGFTPEHLYALPVVTDPQLTPDGSAVIHTVTTADREADENRTAIWSAPADGGPAVRLVRDGGTPRIAPDGRHLAFLRGEPAQLWLLRLDGGEACPLTDRPGGAGAAVWSPDGTRIAFAAADRTIAEPRVQRRLDPPGTAVHLYVVDLASGAVTRLVHGDVSVATPAWSPDGTELAYAAATGDDRDLTLAVGVFTVPAAGGPSRPVISAGGAYLVAGYSPDGRELLLVGQDRVVDGHDRLWTVDVAGGVPRSVAPGFDRQVMVGGLAYPGAVPRYDGDRIVFCARDAGRVHVYDVRAGGGPRRIIGGERVVGGLSLAGPRMAMVAADATSNGEIWLVDGGAERRLTDLCAAALPGIGLVAPEERTFTAPDGTPLHGYVLRPPAAGPGPLLVDVHGGPHNAWGPAFDGVHAYQQTLVAAGWTVLCLNPRGSDGYGEAFWTGAKGRWGLADEGDFLAAVDALVADGTADPDRVAIHGYSYGGYMTCWLTARTDRFAAAVAGGLVADLASMVGTSDEGHHLGTVELDPDSLVETSPLTHVDGVRAPTLVLHGADDATCPLGQARQWFTALRARRRDTELVTYPGAGHGFLFDGRPSHRVDYNVRVHDWLARHVPSPAAARRRGIDHWQRRLDELIVKYRVPGASLAVLDGDELTTAASGLLNVATGVAATADSLFQIGSITKVYTACLALQLVDEGRLDLDAPVVDRLPEFRLADPDALGRITLRHLLTHSSGIEGDHFIDTGRGDDALRRYVETVADLGLSHPVGATMSYCNTGYGVAGRLIETLTGTTWAQALRDRLLAPAGLTDTVPTPEEAMRYRVAHGHDAPDRLASQWMLPESAAPAGATLCATAADVVRFARLHLRGGRHADRSVLSAATVTAMQQPQVTVPDRWTLGTHWGLGWILFDWAGRPVYGHDGGTLGQASFLRVVPDAGVAVALLTNGGHGRDLYTELFSEILGDRAGITVPAGLVPAEDPPPVDPARYLGVYERVGVRIEVMADAAGTLSARSELTGPLADLIGEPPTETVLRPVAPDVFVTRDDDTTGWTPVVFFDLPDGVRCLHTGVRATPRIVVP